MSVKRANANKKLIKILNDFLKENPDMRFGQALINLGFTHEAKDSDGVLVNMVPYYEESTDTLEIVEDRQYALHKKDEE